MSSPPLISREVHDKWKSKYRTPENFRFYQLAYSVIHQYFTEIEGLVLDAGCGTGEKTIRLSAFGYPVVGLDFSPAALEEAYATIASSDYSNATWIVRGDLTILPFPDATFGGIVIWGVFMHIPSLERAIAELCRVLKPGGKIVVYDVHTTSLDVTLLRWAKRLSGRGKNTRTGVGIENWVASSEGPVLVRWMYDSALKDLFAKNGVAFEWYRAGRFTELFVYLRSPVLRRLVHIWNDVYFRFVRWPLPSYALMAFGRKRRPLPLRAGSVCDSATAQNP